MALKLRNAIGTIVRTIFKLLSTVETRGVDNVPIDSGCILAMNHLSRLDPAVAFVTLNRNNMSALVADKYKSTPGISWLVNIFNGIWVNREDADYKAIRNARDYLLDGNLLGIAPEGTRSDTGALIEAKTGVAFLAEKARVPLVPIAVWGTEKAFSELAHFRRPHIIIEYGEPFTLPPLDRKDRAGSLQKNTDEIMCRIAVMLPPQYHGVYTDHPQLQELLAEQAAVQP